MNSETDSGLRPKVQFTSDADPAADDFATMRVAEYDRYGPPDVLHEAIVRKPTPRNDEVLVRVHGASIGGGEDTIRAGKITLISGRKFPRRSGVDFAGEIISLGAEIAGFALGDRVCGVMPHGTFGAIAEFVAVPAARLAPAPRSLDLLEAAALPAVGTTAITALRIKADLRAGERLLIRGASGGVGSVAVQLGKAMGAHVTGLASARNLDWVRHLGADEAVDYSGIKATDLGRFDVVLDVVGTDMESYRRILSPGGRMVGISFDPDHLFRTLIYLAATSVFGSRRVRAFSNNPSQSVIAELTGLVESGAVRPLVDRVWPLSEIAKAHRTLEAGGVRGKQVIRLV